jgi:hypothetical protein
MTKLYGTPEEIAEFVAAYQRGVEENRARIAAGAFGDVPDPLTEEDETILDRIWDELRREGQERAARMRAAKKKESSR